MNLTLKTSSKFKQSNFYHHTQVFNSQFPSAIPQRLFRKSMRDISQSLKTTLGLQYFQSSWLPQIRFSCSLLGKGEINIFKSFFASSFCIHRIRHEKLSEGKTFTPKHHPGDAFPKERWIRRRRCWRTWIELIIYKTE